MLDLLRHFSCLGYVPFVDLLPGSWKIWPLWLLPLCAAVSVVYKSIKCRSADEIPRQAVGIFFWILIGMAVAAGILAGVVAIAQHYY